MSSWPPGPPGSGMSRLNDPAYAHELRSAPAPGPQKASPETGGRLTSATASSPEVERRGPSAIAVLVPGGLRGIGGGVFAEVANLAHVLHQAVTHDVRQVWIGPSMAATLGLPPELDYKAALAQHVWLGPARRDGWQLDPDGLAPWLELRGNPRYPDARLELVFPGWDLDGNPFARSRNAGELLGALELFAREVGLRYRWSPGATGLALMRMVHSGSRGIQLPVQGTPAPIAVEQRGALDSWAPRSWLVWTGAVAIASWLHAWDINGMYLAAASSAELGFGEASHVKRPKSVEGAGYWRATVRDRQGFPTPPPFKVDGRAHWYTTPAIAYLTELGYRPRLLEAWVYPQRRRWLEPWYEHLRDARTALMATQTPAGVLALGAVKRVYTAALGRLAGSWLKAGDATFRPDWRHVVIDRARINLHRHLLHARIPPIGMDEDQVLWWCGSPDAAAAAAQVGLEVSDQLGKWKHQGVLGSHQALDLVEGAGSSTSKRLRALLDALEAPGGPL